MVLRDLGTRGRGTKARRGGSKKMRKGEETKGKRDKQPAPSNQQPEQLYGIRITIV